jgi:hypothetical protein
VAPHLEAAIDQRDGRRGRRTTHRDREQVFFPCR